MQINFNDIASRISHNGEKGTARENMLELYIYPFPFGNIVFINVKNILYDKKSFH